MPDRIFKSLLAVALACLLIPVAPAAALDATDADAAADDVTAAADGTIDDFDTDDIDLSAPHADDSILVVYEDDVDTSAEEDAVADDLADAGLDVSEVVIDSDDSDDADTATTVLASIPDGTDVEDAIAAAADTEGVAWAQPDYTYELLDGVTSTEALTTDTEATDTDTEATDDDSELDASATVNDPVALVNCASSSVSNQYYLYGDNASTIGTYGADVLDAWDYTTTDGAVTVVTMDTGVNLSHEDLADNILDEYCWDCYSDEELEATSSFNGDGSGHGTHVAGIITGTANNATGIAGVSYNANLICYKVFDDTGSYSRTSAVIAAYKKMLEVAEEEPDLGIGAVNLSLGAYGDGDSTTADRLLHSYISLAREDGILTICAGGNGDGSSTPYTDMCYPSDWDECVSVTALAEDGTNAVWSDFNEDKDISAPGVNILSTYNSSSDSYAFMSGTSMAAPVVTGVVALLLAACPDAEPDDIVEAISETAGEIDDSEDPYTRNSGYTVVESEATGWNAYWNSLFGTDWGVTYTTITSGSAGIVDAAEAVKWLLCAQDVHWGGTATCTTQAVCELCGASYGDLAAHSVSGTATWEWADDCSSATATVTCTCNGGHTLTATATADDGIVYTVLVEPTATTSGWGSYTATVEFEGVAFTSARLVTIEATGIDDDDSAYDDDADDTDDDSLSDDGQSQDTDDDATSDDGQSQDADDDEVSGDDGDSDDTTSDSGSTGSTDSSTSSTTTTTTIAGAVAQTSTAVVRRANTMKASGGTVKVRAAKLKKHAVSVSGIAVKKAKGRVSIKKTSGPSKIAVSNDGTLTVKKGTKRGTYVVKALVKAAGTSAYKAASQTVTVTVVVR